jgi:hypothetical protein
MTDRSVAPPRRRPKRVLTVRMLLAKLAWLEGQPYWRKGRAVWEGPGARLAPEAADLARAQRTLTRLRSYPFAAREALGDSEAWLRERLARLEQAKHLRTLTTADADLPLLARRAQAGDGPAIQHLTALLTAEALCLNPLQPAPSAALLAAGTRAAASLHAMAQDEGAPLAGRALAALTLGAVHRAAGVAPAAPLVPNDLWLRRAYQWGRRAGLSREPALIASLLPADRGGELADRCARVLLSASAFRLGSSLLRELLAAGTPAAQVIALAEAAQSADSLAEQLLRRRRELPDRGSPQRRAVARQLREQRQQAVSELGELFHQYARTTREPVDLHRIVQFARSMLELGRVTPDLTEAIARPLRRGLDLPPELLGGWLEILVEQHGRLWNPTTIPTQRTRRGEPRLGVWLEGRWNWHVRPALELLKSTRDPALVREALSLMVHHRLSCQEWEEPEQCRLVLTVAREAWVADGGRLIGSLCWTVSRLPDAASARALLQPLFQAARGASPAIRNHLLEMLLDELPGTRQGLRDALIRLVRYVPRLARFAEEDQNENCLCRAAVSAALQLDRAVPDRAESWLDGLLSHLTALARPGESRIYDSTVQTGFHLALALADGEITSFQAIFRASMQHPSRHETEALEQGLSVLSRFPGLRAPLAQEFPRQPHRCAQLLVRLGLAARLGPDALAPLAELHAEPVGDAGGAAEGPSSADWRAVEELSPELSSTAALYRRTQALLGGSTETPPGVRRALGLPQRLSRELEYLEQRLAAQPDRADLAARARTLRARLADPDGLLTQVREEVRERLEQVTVEAQIAAAEQQVLACYRHRLTTVIGPLPECLLFDADLMNATLLTVDITENRRLLLKLLRAHLAGDRHWREQHPANAAFLQARAAEGLDVSAWLASHPRRYPCPGAAGGRVHLRLEGDPLRILQMGNYFDTCLSFGGCNSFSTVANACELNKRVVYATDGAGHVVGRKLIAINAEGALVGFQTYTSLPEDSSNQALRAVFRHYLHGFAERCRLALADSGRVPTLFAQDWYDDGTVAWDDEETPADWSSTASRPQPRPK